MSPRFIRTGSVKEGVRPLKNAALVIASEAWQSRRRRTHDEIASSFWLLAMKRMVKFKALDGETRPHPDHSLEGKGKGSLMQ
jgi:hypothetical protein